MDILPLKVLPFCNLQQLFAYERDYVSACHYLSLGIEYTGQKRADYTRILFMLSKGMVGLVYYNTAIWNYAVIFIYLIFLKKICVVLCSRPHNTSNFELLCALHTIHRD